MSHHHQQSTFAEQSGLGKSSRSKIQCISGTQVQRLIGKLQVIENFLPTVKLYEILSPEDFSRGEVNTTLSNTNKHGDVAVVDGGGKHVLQEVSIIGHLRRIGALNNGTARAIELGAGTGKLSDRLQRATDCKLDHIMIDRQYFVENQCRDRILKARLKARVMREKKVCTSSQRSSSPLIQRVVVDIGSFRLNDYILRSSSETSSRHQTLCMSKHLCGPACDLTLHSILRSTRASTTDGVVSSPPPTAIATCCHYLCTWDSFVGKEFWLALGLSREDFVVATTVSQWSSLKQAKKKGLQLNEKDNSLPSPVIQMEDISSSKTQITEELPNLFHVASLVESAVKEGEATVEENFLPSRDFEKTFPKEEKANLGVKVKQLLDLARAAYCQKQQGYKSVELVRYTTRSIEDRLLLLY